MDELSARRLVTAGHRRREPAWKRVGVGAVGGVAMFIGVIFAGLVGWGMVELIRSFPVTFATVAAWGMFLSAIAGGVMSIPRRDL